MLALRELAPLGIFPTVLNHIQMFHVVHPIMCVTDGMVLGGEYCPQLVGPTPANLVPLNVLAVPMDAAPDPLPRNVGNSANANQGNNWLVDPPY